MAEKTPRGDLSRLARAMEVALRWRRTTPRPSAEDVLATHADLHDLLAPILAASEEDEEPPRPAEATAAGPAHKARFGEFDVLREIGRGGMGVVYLARQRGLDRQVALKVLPQHLTLSPSALTRFQREARTLARLDHQGIVRVLAVGDDLDLPWYAMELIDGEPLDALLDRARRDGTPAHCDAVHLRRACEIVATVADALAHAHAAGVVHRDVKPANILLRRDGTAVLTDFGLARSEGAPTVTLTGTVAGTPNYMAPEQITGAAVNAGTDVFALGATLYEALTLRRPFDAATTQLVLANVLTRDPVDPRRLVAGIPGNLVAVLGKAMEKTPSKRYATASALADDLRAVLDFRPVSARRASMVERAARFAQREPAKAGLLLVLALALPVIAALAGYLLGNLGEIRLGRTKRERDRIDGLLGQGAILLGTNRVAEAKRAFTAVLAADADDLEAQMNLVSATERADGAAAALALLDALTASHAKDPVHDRQRAVLLRALAREDEARAIEAALPAPSRALDFQFAAARALQLTLADDNAVDGDTAAHQLLAAASSALRLMPAPRLSLATHLAFGAHFTGDATAARDADRMLETFWPAQSPIVLDMQAAAAMVFDPARARALLERAIALEPGHWKFHSNLSAVLRALNDLPAYAEAAQRAAELSQDATEFGGAGAAHIANGDMPAAEKAWQRAVEIDPRCDSALHFWGYHIAAAGRVAEGIAKTRAAIAAAPEAAKHHFLLGFLLRRNGDLDGAEQALRAGLALAPANERAHCELVEVLSARGDIGAEQEEHERYLAVRPSDRVARDGLVYFFLDPEGRGHRDLDSAVRVLTAPR